MAQTGLLTGKHVLVTGASSGIGRTIAETFAGHGASLVLTARREAALKEVNASCMKLGAKEVRNIPVDLSSASDVDALGQGLLKDYGCIDVLVNCAGMGSDGTPLKGNPDDWEKVMALNLMTPMRLTRILSPAMADKEEGVILNIGSVAGMEPMTASCTYAASKWGLRGWSLSCYNALRLKNIKVVYIAPAYVDTPLVGDRPNLIRENMLKTADIAEAVMLAFRTSSACAPTEIVLRLTRSAMA